MSKSPSWRAMPSLTPPDPEIIRMLSDCMAHCYPSALHLDLTDAERAGLSSNESIPNSGMVISVAGGCYPGAVNLPHQGFVLSFEEEVALGQPGQHAGT